MCSWLWRLQRWVLSKNFSCEADIYILLNKGDGECDDPNNNCGCDWDGGDCCGSHNGYSYCSQCECLDPNPIQTTMFPSTYFPTYVTCDEDGILQADACDICPYKLYIFVNDYNEANYDQEHFEENSILQYLYCKGDCYWNSTLEECQQIAGTFVNDYSFIWNILNSQQVALVVSELMI